MFVLPPLFDMKFKKCMQCKKQRLARLIDEKGVCALCNQNSKATFQMKEVDL